MGYSGEYLRLSRGRPGFDSPPGRYFFFPTSFLDTGREKTGLGGFPPLPLPLPIEKALALSGIRTHAHRSGLRPERSALDRSAILTTALLWVSGEKRTDFQFGVDEKKDMEDPGIDPGTSRMLSERSTI